MFYEYLILTEIQIRNKIAFLEKRIKENNRLKNKMFSAFKNTGNLKCITAMNNYEYTNYQNEEEIKHLKVLLSMYG